MAYRSKYLGGPLPGGRGKLYYNYRPHRYIKTYRPKKQYRYRQVRGSGKYRKPGWSAGQRRTYRRRPGQVQLTQVKSYHSAAKRAGDFQEYPSTARRRLEF